MATSFLRYALALSLLPLAAAHAFIPASEHAVLAAIYNQTGGPGWTNNTNWNPFKTRTECSWYGITCDAAGDHVIKINLDSNNLTGALPALANLPLLNEATFAINQLTALPPDLTSLTQLTKFNAAVNQIAGTLPDLSGLTALSEFNVDTNQLSGPLPALPAGIAIFIGRSNAFTGPIPVLQNFVGLNWFSVSNNLLSGQLPVLQGLNNLQIFYASNNLLTGSIPSLAGLANLSRFGVAFNQLSGTVPGAPFPNQLVIGGSYLCPNRLEPRDDPAWDAATGQSPWWLWCDTVFTDGFDA